MGGEISLRVRAERVRAAFTESKGFRCHGFLRGVCVLNGMHANGVNEGYHATVCTFAVSKDVFY